MNSIAQFTRNLNILSEDSISQIRSLDEWGRSLAWIRHQPAELVIPGSNPGGPAIFLVFSQSISLRQEA